MTVTLDGIADDGPAGAGDNILPDVENVTGSIGHDRIEGDGDGNVINPDRGRDVVETGAGDDRVLAQDIRRGADPGHGDTDAASPERDVIRCGPGRDDVYADDIDSVSGDCEYVQHYSGPVRKRRVSLVVLNGGGGADRLVATGGAPALVRARGGDDRVYARNGERATISCGSGRDRVKADRGDSLGRDCEVVLRRGRSG